MNDAKKSGLAGKVTTVLSWVVILYLLAGIIEWLLSFRVGRWIFCFSVMWPVIFFGLFLMLGGLCNAAGLNLDDDSSMGVLAAVCAIIAAVIALAITVKTVRDAERS